MPNIIQSKLYFENANGWGNLFPVGGVPVFNQDLQALENTSKMYGHWAITNKYNVILQGCEVDEISLTGRTVKIKEGYFTIAGIVYYTAGFTSAFPFSLIAGTQTPDTRTFKDGSVHDVAIAYDYAIRTSGFNTYQDIFSAPSSLPLKPSNLGNEIFFDPFTNARLEYLLKNISYGLNEYRQGNFLATFDKTETGKNIVGGVCSEFSTIGKGRWKYYGYQRVAVSNYYLKITSNPTYTLNGNIGNKLKINAGHLPSLKTTQDGNHRHDFWNAFYSESDGVPVDNRVKRMSVNNRADRSLNNIIGSGGVYDTDNKPLAFADSVDFDGVHGHQITGGTGTLLNNNDLDITPASIDCNAIQWKGYNATTDAHLGNLPYTNR